MSDTIKTPEQEAPKVNPVEAMKTLAHNYQVPMSDGTIQQIAESAKDGNVLPAFEEHMKTSAQGLYPTFAKQIAAGIPTALLLDPYRQVAKRVLGEQFEPDFVGNTVHAKALHGGMDPATGRPAPMGLDQWTEHLKTHPSFGWANTENGMAARNDVLRTIHEAFTNGGMQ